jgi:hypothetical protein
MGEQSDFLLALADHLAEIGSSLRQVGFTSCFVDEDWMKGRSTADEWLDFGRYKREYAREVLQSRSPAAIEHSNPGEYEWRSSEISGRVQRRFEKFGDVHALFLDASRRHLVQLTVAEQRMGQMFERATEFDRAECERRLAEFQRRRDVELQRADTRSLAKRLFSSRDISATQIQRLFVSMVAATVSGSISSSSITWINLAAPESLEERSIELQLDVEPGDLQAETTGALYVTTVLRYRAESSISRQLHVARILPGRFDDYSRFGNRAEIALCFGAWLHVAIYIISWMIEAGWRLEG